MDSSRNTYLMLALPGIFLKMIVLLISGVPCNSSQSYWTSDTLNQLGHGLQPVCGCGLPCRLVKGGEQESAEVALQAIESKLPYLHRSVGLQMSYEVTHLQADC